MPGKEELIKNPQDTHRNGDVNEVVFGYMCLSKVTRLSRFRISSFGDRL